MNMDIHEEDSPIYSDYCHLMSNHNDPIQLQDFNDKLIIEYKSAPCKISNCPMAS